MTSAEHIKGLKIKGPETKKTSSYIVDGNTIKVPDGYNAPYSVYASFLKEGELTDDFRKGFCNNNNFGDTKTYPKFHAQEIHDAVYDTATGKTMATYYGSDMKSWWNIDFGKTYKDVRYVAIHFCKCWNDKENGGAASKMKVAELDIITE